MAEDRTEETRAVAEEAVVHPGEILATEFLEPLGITAYRLAREIGVPQPRVSEILKKRRSITADTALRLGIYFGLPAQFWLNLQNEHDLRKASGNPAHGKIRPSAA